MRRKLGRRDAETDCGEPAAGLDAKTAAEVLC